MKFVSSVQLDRRSCWLASAFQLFWLLAPNSSKKKTTLWMMLQMQLGWDGHAECPDLKLFQRCQEARARWRDRALDRRGYTDHPWQWLLFKRLVPALQQQEFLLNEICSAVKTSRQHARSSQAARTKSGNSKAAARSERGDALPGQLGQPRRQGAPCPAGQRATCSAVPAPPAGGQRRALCSSVCCVWEGTLSGVLFSPRGQRSAQGYVSSSRDAMDSLYPLEIRQFCFQL